MGSFHKVQGAQPGALGWEVGGRGYVYTHG